MEDKNRQYEQLLLSAPGGAAKIAFDDMLTVLSATDNFFSMIKNVSDKSGIKLPVSLLRMVYSNDIINLTQQIAAQKLRKDNVLTLNFRTLQNDGSFKWLMISGNKTDETHSSGTKTVPVYSCTIADITSIMINYKKLEQMADYHRIIDELSRELFFEYEIATDTITFTETFREVFGKDNVISGFRKKLDKTKLIYSEELPAVIAIYNAVMSGRKQVRFELRLIPKDGTPCWYNCYASIIFDENKNPYKVVGKLSARSLMTKEEEAKIYKPQLDAATGVCTKESAELMITEAAAKQPEEELSALLVLDIRNYKNINDIKKAVNGENIITSIGAVIKKNVRTSDIIGRMAMGEFVIYVRNVPSDRAVYEIAERLCSEIEAVHSYEHTKNCLSSSIGVAFHRGAAEYQTLSANANTAMVLAKKVPVSSFEVFSGVIG